MILRKKYKFNLDNFEKKLNSKNFYKNFCMFIFGILFYAIGISVFFAPNDIVTTGSTGLSIILNNYIKIDLSLLVFLGSLPSNTTGLPCLRLLLIELILFN